MTAVLPLFGDFRDWTNVRARLIEYAQWNRHEDPDTLISLEGHGRAVRMPRSSAMDFLRHNGFVEADHARPRPIRHRDGTETQTQEWWGPHGATAHTATRHPRRPEN